jgi:prepilin-type N-terminal cleavage/methylation domain-containing protein/prepilin-type processing-associated H-X9-DG protein
MKGWAIPRSMCDHRPPGSDPLARPQGCRHQAFTLVELLVVIAIIGVLFSLVLPAINQAKENARKAQCINHLRQLSLANQMYVDDHGGFLPYNFGVADTLQTIENRTFLNWINNVMTWELDPANTNINWATSGGFSGYLSRSVNIYRCPSDRVLSLIQQKAGWTRRLRSYSMNAMVGNAGKFSKDGSNVNNPHYRQFLKKNEIPNPVDFFVFIEEHPDSINDAYFLNKFYSGEWFDLPASFHNDSAVLTFADGHVESHRWTEPSTKQPNRPDAAGLPLALDENERTDFTWLLERTSLKLESPPTN